MACGDTQVLKLLKRDVSMRSAKPFLSRITRAFGFEKNLDQHRMLGKTPKKFLTPLVH